MGSLSQAQQSILIGSLLGDGTLRLAKGKLNALFEVNHTVKQKLYVDWKYENFKPFVLTGPKAREGNGTRIAYRFTTQSLPIFTSVYKRFYENNRKIIPTDLKLDPLALAVWFMDDGSKSRSSVYLNTQQFTIQDQVKLLNSLKKEFNLVGKLNRDKQYFRIRITTESTKLLVRIIRSFVLPMFNYKLGDDPVTTDSKEEIRPPRRMNNTPTPVPRRVQGEDIVYTSGDRRICDERTGMNRALVYRLSCLRHLPGSQPLVWISAEGI